MLALLLFILFAFSGVNSQLTFYRCGFERTKLLIKSTTSDICSTVTLARNCYLTNVLDPLMPYGSCMPCQWNGNTQTCYTETLIGGCYPSCFSGGRTLSSAASCTSVSLATCDKTYVVSNSTFGTYSLCFTSSSSCLGRPCDTTCTGAYQPTSSCAGKNQYDCPDYFYDNGTVSTNCGWTGTACAPIQTCYPGCNGINITTNCALYNNNALQCQSHYVRTGNYGYQKQNCVYTPSTGACTQSNEYCSLPYIYNCTGTFWSNFTCSSFHTAPSCNSAYVLDGVMRQCQYNYGDGNCNRGDQCSP